MDSLKETLERITNRIRQQPHIDENAILSPVPIEGHNQPLPEYDHSRNVTLSNALARAAQGLTLVEKRVVMCCISQINSREDYDPTVYIKSSVSAHKYSQQFGFELRTAYKELKRAGDKLLTRTVGFFEWRTSQGKQKPVFIRANWVQHVEYVPQKGYIEILWTHKIGAELKGLKDKFTTYKLKNASSLRSIYSWRLLELFESFSDTGWFEVSVNDFAKMMDATPKQLQDFANIRRRMIEPAVKDLVEKDGWFVKWQPIKYGGRRISGIRFEFKRDSQQPLG